MAKDKKLLDWSKSEVTKPRPIPLSPQNIGVPVTFANRNLRFVPLKLFNANVGKGKPIPFGRVERVSADTLRQRENSSIETSKSIARERNNPIKTKEQLIRAYKSSVKKMAKDQQDPNVPGTYGMGNPARGFYGKKSRDKKLPLPKKRGGEVGYSQRWKTGREG